MYIKFLDFLSDIPESPISYKKHFVLKSFTYWHGKKIDIELIADCHYNRNLIECIIPYRNKKEVIFNERDKNKLLEQLFNKGLGIIKEKIKMHSIIYSIESGNSSIIVDLEKEFNYNFFRFNHRLNERFEVWTYKKIKSTTISRVGKDNITTSTGVISNIILSGTVIIKDDYLLSLIHQNKVINEEDYGYVPSHPETNMEDASYNEELTNKFRLKYDPYIHYKSIINSGFRNIKSNDDSELQQALS